MFDSRGNDLISGGEDGAVCIWDTRDFKNIDKIQPYLNTEIDRPELGKWIGAVGYNEDFLVNNQYIYIYTIVFHR